MRAYANTDRSAPGAGILLAARVIRVLWLASIVMTCGCGPKVLVPVSESWPLEIQGYKLYPTPQAYMYATTAATAGEIDRWLERELPRIEDRWEIQVGHGVAFAIRADDPAITGMQPWPVCRNGGKLKKHLPVTYDRKRIAIPDSLIHGRFWICALPADDFFEEAWQDNRRAADRRFRKAPILSQIGMVLTSWPFLLMVPGWHASYMEWGDAERRRVLAIAVLNSIDLPPATLDPIMKRAKQFYEKESRRAFPRD